jgi:hypothetical protein
MTYSYTICDMQSGARLQEMVGGEAPSAGTYDRRMGSIGQGGHSFQMADSDLSASQWQELLYPKKRTISICWDGFCVYDGTIERIRPNLRTGQVDIEHREVRSWLQLRHQFGIGTYGTKEAPMGTKAYTNRTKRGIILQILWYATQAGYSPTWNLPFTSNIGWDELGGGIDRTYDRYTFPTAEVSIGELEDSENGPDVDFQPRLGGTRDWLVRIGSALVPRLGGPLRELTLSSAPLEPDAIATSLTVEGDRMVTGVFEIGLGTGDDMHVGQAATVSVTGGIPSMDVSRDDFKELDRDDALAGHARAEVALYQSPITQLQVDTRAASLFPGMVPGSTVRMLTDGEFWIPAGYLDMRCIGYRGRVDSDVVNIDLQ